MITGNVARLRTVNDDVIQLGARAIGVNKQFPRTVADSKVRTPIAALRITKRFAVPAIFPEQRSLPRRWRTEQRTALVFAVELSIRWQSSAGQGTKSR